MESLFRCRCRCIQHFAMQTHDLLELCVLSFTFAMYSFTLPVLFTNLQLHQLKAFNSLHSLSCRRALQLVKSIDNDTYIWRCEAMHSTVSWRKGFPERERHGAITSLKLRFDYRSCGIFGLHIILLVMFIDATKITSTHTAHEHRRYVRICGTIEHNSAPMKLGR